MRCNHGRTKETAHTGSFLFLFLSSEEVGVGWKQLEAIFDLKTYLGMYYLLVSS